MMTYRSARLAAICAVVLAVACCAVPRLSAQEAPPFFEPGDCPVTVPDGVEVTCGQLTTPEDPDEPAGATVQLSIAILHSRSPNPQPDPVLYTEGGPGLSSLTALYYLSQTALRDQRNIILMEQRGNRHAQPSLMCDVSIWREDAGDDTPCLDGLRAQGIDLSRYTAQHIVADIEALRQALGIETWNLYGTSYSTRLMLLTMQAHPEAVRSAILDSVLPPDTNGYLNDPAPTARVLSQMFDDCAAEPACAAAYPNLEARFYALFSRLNAEPVTITIADDADGHRRDEPITEVVSGYTLLSWMVTDAFYGPAYNRGKASYLPLLIDRVEAGQVELLNPWVEAQLYDLAWLSPDFAWGLYFAISCQDEYPDVTAAALVAQEAEYPALEGYRRYVREIEVCEQWGLSAVPLGDEPITSDIPTLILADSYDPVTPPEWGQRAAGTLSRSYSYQLPASGHSGTGASACVQAIMRSFVDDPTRAPEAGCLADEPPPEFVLPAEVLLAPGFYRTLPDFDLGVPRGKPWLEVVVVAALLSFLGMLLYLVVAGVFSLVLPGKRRPAPEPLARFAYPAAGVLALAGLAIPVLMSLLNHQLNADPIMRYFGLPADSPLSYGLGVASLAAAVFTAVVVVFAGMAWARRWWKLPKRLLLTAVGLLAAVFTILLMRWGLVMVLL